MDQQTQETGPTDNAAPAQHPNEVKKKNFTRVMHIPMSTDERLERGDRQAFLVGEIQQKKDDAKGAAASAKARIDELQAELRRISSELRHGKVEASVRCQTQFLYRLNTVREIRLDTGEILSERAMTAEESQLELGVEQPNGAGAPSDDDESGDDGDDEGDDEAPDSSDDIVGESDDDDDDSSDDQDEEPEPHLPTARGNGGASAGGRGKGGKRGGKR